jgi:zinc protease
MARGSLILIAALASCSPSTWSPRFGGLDTRVRPLEFEHGIQVFQAKNGLRVALLRDDRTNLVSVDTRYLVGSAEDPAGRAGMAHLVEHASFLARAAADQPTLADRLGDVALQFNAWTNPDETHYTETGFANELDDLLAVEAARMTETCDQIDDTLFQRERDVVLEEEAQRHGPLDDEILAIYGELWGSQHPYARGVGTREVADAPRSEACDFVSKYYGPQHAILVVTGDIDLDEAETLIGRHFGPIEAHGDGTRADIPDAQFDGRRLKRTVDVTDSTAIVFFPAPPWASASNARFRVASLYLQSELADADRAADWVTDVDTGLAGGSRARALAVYVTVDDPARLDDAVDLVYATAAKVAADDYDMSALEPLILQSLGDYLGSYDDFDGTGAWIADFMQYSNDNWFFLTEMAAYDKLDAAQVKGWVKTQMVKDTSLAVEVTPSGKDAHEERLTVTSRAPVRDVAPWRTPVDPAEAERALLPDTARVDPDITDLELPNGMRILLAPDPQSPIVDARIVYPVGTAADPDDRPGLAYATAALIDSNYELDDNVKWEVRYGIRRGTDISFDVDEQTTSFGVRGLAVFADWHVWRLYFLLDHSVFPKEDIQRMHAAAAAAGDPDQDVRAAALREALFGKDHPYAGAPLTGKDIQRIGGKDMQRFRKAHYKAKGATLIVSGGFDAAAMQQEIELLFGLWDGGAPAAIDAVPAANPVAGPTWIGVRDPDATQAHLTVAFATSSDPEHDRAARKVLEQLVEDRVRVVREGMAASYGISVGYVGGEGGGALAIDGYLDPERGGDALVAVLAELARLRDPDADLAEDFVRARRKALANALGDGAGAVDTANELAFLAEHHLDLHYLDDLATQIGKITLDDLRTLIAGDLQDDRRVVEVSGRADVLDTIFTAAGAKPQMLDENVSQASN